MSGFTSPEVLKQRYLALELATASRLKTCNSRITEERKQKYPNDQKVEFLKGKRKEIMDQLNFIREALARDDFSTIDYAKISDAYLAFAFN